MEILQNLLYIVANLYGRQPKLLVGCETTVTEFSDWMQIFAQNFSFFYVSSIQFVNLNIIPFLKL
jgi:hypothetical protein